MMETDPIESYYLKLEEPLRSTLLFLREHLLQDSDVTQSWKWGLPFFDYKGRYLCYFWKEKKDGRNYIAFSQGKHLNHPSLHMGKRKQIAVYHFNPNQDLVLAEIDEIIALAKQFYDQKE